MPLAILSATPRDAADDLVPVEAEVVEREAELRRAVAHEVVKLGVAQQALGGDAAPVQAGAAGAVAFDDGDLLAELRGADGSDVPAGPPPMTMRS